MTQLEWFRFFAPEYAALSDADATALLTAAELFVHAPCLVGDKLAAATALYAAHMRSLQVLSASGNGFRGAVVSEKEGDLSRTYATGQSSGDPLWNSSVYGPQYQAMIAPCFGASIMTRFGSTPGPIKPFDPAEELTWGYDYGGKN
jgi:hypothetical protein